MRVLNLQHDGVVVGNTSISMEDMETGMSAAATGVSGVEVKVEGEDCYSMEGEEHWEAWWVD